MQNIEVSHRETPFLQPRTSIEKLKFPDFTLDWEEEPSFIDGRMHIYSENTRE